MYERDREIVDTLHLSLSLSLSFWSSRVRIPPRVRIYVGQAPGTCHYSSSATIRIDLSNHRPIILAGPSRPLALINDSPGWPVRVGEFSWGKKGEQAIGSRNGANARNDKISARMRACAQRAPCIAIGTHKHAAARPRSGLVPRERLRGRITPEVARVMRNKDKAGEETTEETLVLNRQCIDGIICFHRATISPS